MISKISAVIPVFNTERIIKDCLESIRWVNEIICVDMGSQDKTIDISKLYDARIIKNMPSDGNFDINRKLGFKIASGDWILKIDSDDRLTKTLQLSIKSILNDPKVKYCGYKLFNRVFFFNKELNYGIKTKDSHELRLFKKNKWRYNPFKFHELITTAGKTDFLKGEYLHFNSQSIREFINKTNIYTELDSERKYSAIQTSFLHTIISPIWKFFELLVIKRGILDGTHGLIVNLMYVIYNYIYKLKIWSKK